MNTRPLYEIAQDIRDDWGKKMSIHAKPYVDAMYTISSIDEMYYLDSAKEIVLRFLCNAHHWRGETARTIKKELKTLAKVK